MSSGKSIRNKITSVNNIRKITNAMELVAASKTQGALKRKRMSRPYYDNICRVIGHLAQGHAEYHHRYFAVREVRRVGIIVVSTDRGLCGSLNTNLFRKVVGQLKNWQADNVSFKFCLIGRKAETFFKRMSGEVLAQAAHICDKPKIEDLIGIVGVMLDGFVEEKLDAVYIAHNDFINTMTQKPVLTQLLPLVPAEGNALAHYWDYIYEPDSRELLQMLMKRYVESATYQAVVENIACEQAARMVAMKSASENAKELIDNLKLMYNKARQAAITQEIAEIVGGASAV